LEGIEKNPAFIMIWSFIVIVQFILGNYGGKFFSVFSDGLSGMQWCVVLLFALIVIPTNMLSKLIVFNVLKLGDGDDDLEEEVKEDIEEIEDKELLHINL